MKNILSGVVIVIGLILILLSTKSEPEVVQKTTKENTTEILTKYTIETSTEMTTEEETEEVTTEEVTEEETKEIPINRWGIELNDDEITTLEQIVWLEAGNQPDEGIQAVAEVVLNRMYSDVYPNDLISVLSQRGQFCTWYNRDNARVSDNVKKQVRKVLKGKTNVLPYETLYFSTSPLNSKVECIIGGHYFCNQ